MHHRSRFPRRPISVKPVVESLEARDVPSSLYAVQLVSPSSGVHGDSACSVIAGGLTVRPEFDPDGDGVAEVVAGSKAEAVRLAVGGLVRVDTGKLWGSDQTYAFGPSTAGTTAGGHTPFRVTGDRIALEDIAAYRFADWDYNDAYWLVRVVEMPAGTAEVGSRFSARAPEAGTAAVGSGP